MASMRVMNIAKKVGMSPKEAVEKLNSLGFDVKSHATPLNEAQAKKAIEALSGGDKKEDNAQKETADKNGATRKDSSGKQSDGREDKPKTAAEIALEERRARAKERAANAGGSGLLGSDVDLLDKDSLALKEAEEKAKREREEKAKREREEKAKREKEESEKKKAEFRDDEKNAGSKKSSNKANQMGGTSEASEGKAGKTSKKTKGDNPVPKAAAQTKKMESVVDEIAKAHQQLTGLMQQVKTAEEKKKVQEALLQNKKRMEAAAKAVAKQKAVEERLRAKQRKGNKGPAGTGAGTKQGNANAAPKRVISADIDAKTKKKLGSLLSQISSEKERMEEAGMNVVTAGQRKKSQNKRGKFEPNVPELEPVMTKEDRYAAMAAAAEKMQRDKVLAEARRAVKAASHEGEGRRKKRKEKREAQAREKAELEAIEHGLDPDLVFDDSVAEIPEGATVAQFAEALKVPPNDVIKRLFLVGQALTLTQTMSQDLIELIADDLDRKIRIVSPEEEFNVVYNDTEDDLVPRPPVVTVMGHVDHGKTSLLDAIRDTAVIEKESGGITQHIGASVVFKDDRQITFIDTPGHEAFTAMRARGAQVTDVIVLVVAADDGVMPQTIEAINHAKAAEVPVVVAVNKIDKDGANPEKVKQELTEYEIVPEEWGGPNMFVEISAKKRQNIDALLETILLQADVLELKANPDALATGFVVEANLDKGRGPVATVLVERGTLWHGDTVVAGTAYGKARALIGPGDKMFKGVEPGEPAEILGLDRVPVAGDDFRVFKDEREARKLAEQRRLRERLKEQQTAHMSLDDLFNRIEEGKQTDLNLIIKADVQGSIEALVDAFNKMDQSEVKINVVHSAVGGITETDVTLATASDAIIIGFNVRPTGKSKGMAEREKVDIRTYKVIYKCLEDINAARIGMLSPDIVEKDTGVAEVRELFKVPKMGMIAGCYIVEGEIGRNDQIRVVRDGKVVHDGKIASLRHYKDDVKSVKEGYECGIGVEKFQDIKVGDTIEGYREEEVERTE